MDQFTHPLAYRRWQRGLTGPDLAALVRTAAARRGLRSGADKQRVRKWERGAVPEADTQHDIAEALGMPADDVDPDNWPNWLLAGDTGVVPLGPSSTVPALREALTSTMDRRAFLSASGVALTGLAATWAGSGAVVFPSAKGPTNVGGELVTLLEDSTRRLSSIATEQRQHLTALLDGHLTTVTDMIQHGRYDKPTGRRLHHLAASLAQTTAWHRFDRGQHTTAQKHWVAALHSAHVTGDRDMGAAMLGDLAYQAAWCKDHPTAVGILTHAITRTDHPAARSLLHLRLARALAAQGDERETRRALTTAERLLAASTAKPLPAWCSWYGEADLAVDTGQALLDLGDTARAHQLITEGRALLPPERDKTKGVFLAYQAKSHLELKEPEIAARTAGEALRLARRIGAPRCEALVQDLVPAFRQVSAAEGVEEFLALAAG
ncbi:MULTISPECIES: XRE family transcriptional regulator [unclassified Streptomyces]|uniref:XRE family transcriptional regulator n=1 Tax=unclassified Streptomyces TaxID=2593676 RepID=UPI0035E31EE0